MKKMKSVILAMFLISVVSLYVFIFVVPDVTGAMKKTKVLEFGRLSLVDDVTGYFVRNETVYLANHSGEVAYYVGEGVKTRKGVRLLDVLPEDVPTTTPGGAYADILERMNGSGVTQEVDAATRTGVVSYFIDGYEKVFSPDRLDFLTSGEAISVTGQVLNVTRHEGMFANAGEPLYKMVDDSEWYLVFWLSKDSGDIVGYTPGEKVTAKLPRGDIPGKVNRALDQGDAWLVVLEFGRYYENLAQLRKVEMTVVTDEYEGLILDNGSITAVDDRSGVYVKRKSGDFAFVPVKIKKSNGTSSAVWEGSFSDEEGKSVTTVKAYDEILLDPSEAEF
ncbi:hypothetical protein FACS1894127_4620 [Clostridia bacterium]|nr:hypothetical protein FACS1894127_4620 [Clostridia bacterium]